MKRIVIQLVVVLAATSVVAQTTVRPTDMQGWTAEVLSCSGGSTASWEAVEGPGTPPAGTHSWEFMTGANGNSYMNFYTNAYSGARLDSITELDYWTYVQQSFDDRQAAIVAIRFDTSGDGVHDNTLHFEPAYQDGNVYNHVPDQGTLTDFTWQQWDATIGGWWANTSTIPCDGGGTLTAGPGVNTKTLSQILACIPNATIATTNALRIWGGCGGTAWPNFIGNFDLLEINADGTRTAYDFEGPSSAFTITKEGPATTSEGDRIEYDVMITNVGTVEATGIEVTDNLPSGLTYRSSVATQGSYDSGTGIWAVGTLGVGESATLTIIASIDEGTAGEVIENTATITASDPPDLTPDDNAATASFTATARVPTASETGLIALALLLALSAVFVLRR